MKKQISLILIASLVLFGYVSLRNNGQKSYVLSSDQQLMVSGTSTLHDWEMTSTKAEGNALVIVSQGKIIGIKTLVVTLPATSLKSGKKDMDNNAYKTLDASKYSNISFELTEVLNTANNIAKIKGELSISGTSQIFILDLRYKISDNAIRFTGSFPLTFKQFNLKPPTSMFGTLKTGNDLRITFDTQFKTTN